MPFPLGKHAGNTCGVWVRYVDPLDREPVLVAIRLSARYTTMHGRSAVAVDCWSCVSHKDIKVCNEFILEDTGLPLLRSTVVRSFYAGRVRNFGDRVFYLDDDPDRFLNLA